MDRPDRLTRRGVISRAAGDKLVHTVTLYVVRHGATSLNGESGNSVDRIRAWSNVPLTDQGRQEARQAAMKLRGKGVGAIVASDLDRAKETAEIIGRGIGLIPTFSRKLRPWDLGIFTGKSTPESLPKIEVYARDKPDTPVPEGESFNQFRDRAFDGVSEAVAAHPGKIVALITHHRVEMLLLAWDTDGQPPSHEVDIDKLLQKGDPPGGVHKLTTTVAALRGK